MEPESERRRSEAAFAMGMPSRRDEYWKYTNPTELLTEKLSVSPVVGLEDANIFSELDALKIVFCDGVFNPDLSDDLAAENNYY